MTIFWENRPPWAGPKIHEMSLILDINNTSNEYNFLGKIAPWAGPKIQEINKV